MKEKKQNMTFGQSLIILRKQKGLTQTELGNKVGLTKRAIAYYETESKDFPSSKILTKMCKALNTSLEEMITGQIPKEDQKKQKIWKKLKKVEDLSLRDQRAIINLIDSLSKK